MTEPAEVLMFFARATKGTYVYAARVPDAAIQTLWVRKGALRGLTPDVIRVTIAPVRPKA